ncbi:DUF3857 domain-containing protein [Marinilabilia sp.]|uniref:DUF3857 domain-containing protein n=1 Tax=Marinilabilia sp. TaxID=2021252 RepID=UPI0025C5D41B|nr:DUF3857 domain-containing protein [Marinilabilia sp.]
MKKIFFPIFALLITTSSFGKKNPEYAVENIPVNYQKNYPVVVRESVVEIKIENAGKLIEKHREVITIFEDSGFDHAYFIEHYNDFYSISSIDIEIYDASGERMEKANASDIRDISAIDNATIFSDSRVKAYRPDYKTFPLTVVRSWEVKKKSAFFLPHWTPFYGEDIPVLNALLKVEHPKDYNLKYKELNMDDVRKETFNEDQSILQWGFKDYLPEDLEPFSPFYTSRRPFVLLIAGTFDLDGVEGKMDSWESFGNFISQLNQGKQNLPEKTIEDINQLISGVESTSEKIRKIYEYMQNRTRYVSIQIGIGGWEPFDAETVDKLGYGDCKALTNYMRALLGVAGIESHYTLVRAGTYASHTIADFPNNDFNHAILCVPLENDTTWLECTSQYFPSGYLGDFTDGRTVLVIENGTGKIAQTPSLSEKNNIRKTHGFITLNNQGNATATSETQFHGTYYEESSSLLNYMDEADRRKKIIQTLHTPGFKLNNYTFTENKTKDPSISRKLDFSISEYATSVGNRWFIPLNLLNKHTYVPHNSTKRKWPVFISRGWHEADTWEIQLPDNFNADAVPKPIEIISPYGTYKSASTWNSGRINYSREFIVYRGEYPADEYKQFREFLASVVKADQQKCLVSVKQ